MNQYDNYLAKQVEDYLTGCMPTPCMPTPISVNEDGVANYSCEECDKRDCEFWRVFNDE